MTLRTGLELNLRQLIKHASCESVSVHSFLGLSRSDPVDGREERQQVSQVATHSFGRIDDACSDEGHTTCTSDVDAKFCVLKRDVVQVASDVAFDVGWCVDCLMKA